MMSHELAQQLLRLPNGFIYATHGDNEFTISSFQDVWNDSDDPTRSWRLNLRRCPNGQECIR